jgi:gamma-glutamyltranspeptidase
VPGIHGLVTAGHPLAAMAGLQILMKGGNAIDAAVAVGAALNMMEPQMNGIGGNGFMTVYDKKSGHVYSLAMAGATPKAMKAEAMTPETLDWGITAGIVPGNLGGYVAALQRFGTMSLAEVFASGSTTPSTAIRSIRRWPRRSRARRGTSRNTRRRRRSSFRTEGRRKRVSCSGIPTSRRRCAKSSTPSRRP